MFEPGQNKHNMKNTGSYFTKKLSQISSHLKNSLVWKDVTREVGLIVLWRKVHKNGFPPIQQTVKACIISSELCEQKLETWSLLATAIAYLTFLPFAWKCEHSLYLYARETHKRY